MSNEMNAEKYTLIASTMEKLSDDIKFAFSKWGTKNILDEQRKRFRKEIQAYFDRLNNELEIGKYKVVNTKIPRKLKKKMKKRNQIAYSIIKIDEIANISVEIEVK